MSTCRIVVSSGVATAAPSCFARNRASSGMPQAYARQGHRTIGESSEWCLCWLSCAFGGEDAGDTGQVVGDANIGPGRYIEERLDGRKGIVAQFDDQDSAGLEARGGLCDEVGIEFVAFFAAEERDRRFVVVHLACKCCCFAAANVGRIAYDKVEKKRLLISDRRRVGFWISLVSAQRRGERRFGGGQATQEIRFKEVDAIGEVETRGIALCDRESGRRNVERID